MKTARQKPTQKNSTQTSASVQTADYAGQIAAMNRSQAVIEFALDGTILKANDNFLKTLGYTIDEVQGRHQSYVCRARLCPEPRV